MQIFIPTKGRAGRTKTTRLLDKVKLPYTLVVEPNDVENYKQFHSGDFVILARNDMGITYSRDCILRHARSVNLDTFWMLDDDIESFNEVVAGKTIKKDAHILCKAKRVLTKHKASLYSLELRQFGWASKELVPNRIAMQCVLFNVPLCQGIDYDLNIRIREDYDLSLQAILKGYGTLKSGKFCYGIADMKSQEGGMSEWYNDKVEQEEVTKLCQKYPGLVEPTYKHNRYDVKINWRKCKL
jgi:hypothetical protein